MHGHGGAGWSCVLCGSAGAKTVAVLVMWSSRHGVAALVAAPGGSVAVADLVHCVLFEGREGLDGVVQ